METQERLGAFVENLDLAGKKEPLGIFYAFWGVMNIVGVWIFTLVWPSGLFWLVWIPIGLVLMAALAQWRVRALGRRMWRGNDVPWIWTAILLAMPLLFLVFPDLGLYPYSWIFPLTAAWVALGLFATGVHARRPSIALG